MSLRERDGITNIFYGCYLLNSEQIISVVNWTFSFIALIILFQQPFSRSFLKPCLDKLSVCKTRISQFVCEHRAMYTA